jgi:translation initiation factor 2D
MIPGGKSSSAYAYRNLMQSEVVYCSPNLHLNQLVSITQHHTSQTRGPPLAVGRMMVSEDKMADAGKGKAVKVLHTWKDALWQLGGGGDLPEVVELDVRDAVADMSVSEEVEREVERTEDALGAPPDASDAPHPPSLDPPTIETTLSPQGPSSRHSPCTPCQHRVQK